MNERDKEFMKTFIDGLRFHGINVSEKVEVTQKALRRSITNFYSLSNPETASNKMRFFVESRMFELGESGFVLSNEAKKFFS